MMLFLITRDMRRVDPAAVWRGYCSWNAMINLRILLHGHNGWSLDNAERFACPAGA